MKKTLIILAVIAGLAVVGYFGFRGVKGAVAGWAEAQENTGAVIDAALTAYGQDWDIERLAPFATDAMTASIASNPIGIASLTDMMRRYVGPLEEVTERGCQNFSSGRSTSEGSWARATCTAFARGTLGAADFAIELSHDGEVWRLNSLNANVSETSVPVETAAPAATEASPPPETAPSAN